MASLAGAVTALTLIGTPGLSVWSDTTAPVSKAASDTASLSITDSGETQALAARTYTDDFTRLALTGTPGKLYGSLEHSEVELLELNRTDTAFLSIVEDPVDERFFTTEQTVQLSATEGTAQALVSFSGSDTASIEVAEGVGLSITGGEDIEPTDAADLSVSENVTLAVTLSATDTAQVSVTDSSDVQVEEDINSEDVTETASLSVSELVVLDVFSGLVQLPATDDLLLALTEDTSIDVIEGAIGYLKGKVRVIPALDAVLTVKPED